MNIELPTIPAGVLVLLALVAPYAQAVLQRPSWTPTAKKIAAVAIAFILTGLVLGFYYVYTGDTIPAWPVLVLLAIVVAQASYAMVTKASATVLEQRTSPRAPASEFASLLRASEEISSSAAADAIARLGECPTKSNENS